MSAIRPLLDQILEFSRAYYAELEAEQPLARPTRAADPEIFDSSTVFASKGWLNRPETIVRSSVFAGDGIRELTSPLSD